MKLSDIIFEDRNFYRKLANKLGNELRSTFSRDDIHVNMGAYDQDREDDDPLKGKGYGKVEIMQREDLPDSEYNKMKNLLVAKGYEITGGGNFYDYEPNENEFFPNIKFNFVLWNYQK